MSKRKQAPNTGAESTNEPAAPTRPEQMEIPGAERPRIPDLDDAMEAYDDIKGRRCALTAQETEAKKRMVALAKGNMDKIGKDANGVLKYRNEHLVLVIAPTDEKVSVKPVQEGEDVSTAPVDNSEGQ